MFSFISVKNFADMLKNIVHRQIDDVYSTRESEVEKRLEVIERNQLISHNTLTHIDNLLNAIVGNNNQPQPAGVSTEEVRRYAAQVQNSIGGVIEGLPEPPAALTGRRRGPS